MAVLLDPCPERYLPHRYPFLMLDRVLEQQPGLSALARFRTSGSLIAIPQIMLIEAVAQLSGIAAVENQSEGGFLATINQAVFGRAPQPGDTLVVSARVIKSFGRLFLMEGTVCADDQELLSVTLTLGTGPL